jgi:hypothetical protein
MPTLHLASFACDVTPPPGHPLCGGWIEPVRGVDDPLKALGVVLLGPEAPVVLCGVDWCGIRNDAHRAWREALAKAAHTTPERVAVHCVHQHNAPFADLEAEWQLESVEAGPPSLDLAWFDRVVARAADALRDGLKTTHEITHLGTGRAKVEQVASNRRLLGPDGKVRWVRYSATTDEKVRAEPEGLIDPWLRTLSFWGGDRPRAALHFYAVHPMSYYGDGRVSSDFCGLARQLRADDDETVAQVYFNGCAGDVTAGKYNDGSKENRPVLRRRVYEAMKAAWEATERAELKGWSWRVEPLKLPPRAEASFGAAASRAVLEDAEAAKARRGNAAFQLAWLRRLGRPIDVTCLDLGRARVLSLPGEPFVAYQLKAQEMQKDAFVCVAGYGDGGPGYVPTDKAYDEGGYEPTVALAAPSEELLTGTMAKALGAK